MMKKVIFICLLSLTTCLSRPDGTQEAPAPPVISPNAVAPPAKAATNPVVPSVAPPATPPASPSSLAPLSTPVPATSPSTPITTPNDTTPVAPDQKPTHPAEDNKTTKKNTPAGDNKPIVTPTPVPEKNATDANKSITSTLAPAHDDKKNATVTPKDEVTPKPTEPAKPVAVAGRGFDGPSFIGGIILTLGLLAVGFMGFKYYRNQTERNYHTL